MTLTFHPSSKLQERRLLAQPWETRAALMDQSISFSPRAKTYTRLNSVPLLLDEDYERLRDCGIAIEEDAAQRFLVFKSVKLGGQTYTAPECDILVVIPPNYPQAGNDMLWTYPRLRRADGRPIPATLDPAGGDNRTYQGCEFCRWSRHWTAPPGLWRPGKDDVMTIWRRIEWAMQNPDCQ